MASSASTGSTPAGSSTTPPASTPGTATAGNTTTLPDLLDIRAAFDSIAVWGGSPMGIPMGSAEGPLEFVRGRGGQGGG